MLSRLEKEALHEQIGRDAHLVLTRSRKPRKPCKCFNGGRWREPPYPAIDDVVWHMGNCPDAQIGIRPSSIGATVLDVDRGRPGALIAATTPELVLPSRRVGGVHLYYPDDVPRESRNWEFMGAGGEVRSGGGYVIQTWHRDNPVRIAEALDHLRTRSHAIAHDLFEHYRIVVSDTPASEIVLARRRNRRNDPVELRRVRRYLASLRAPSAGSPGNRNVGLFDLIRRQSYRMRHEGNRRQTRDALLALARTYNSMVPSPVEDGELRSMIRQIVGYYRTYAPRDQRRRGRLGGLASGESRRDETLAAKCRLGRAVGMTNEEIAAWVGRSPRQIRRLLSRRSRV